LFAEVKFNIELARSCIESEDHGSIAADLNHDPGDLNHDPARSSCDF